MACTCGASSSTLTIFTGDTVRLRATFRDYAVPPAVGAPIDPDDEEAAWTLYNVDGLEVDSGNAVREDVGIYYIDWTAEYPEGTYFFEFEGDFNSKPQLNRIKLILKFRPVG